MPVADETTRLLIELGRGDRSAADRLLQLVYDELRDLASAFFRRERANHTLQPTALVHEAYLRLVTPGVQNWESRAHFMAVAAKAMRNALVDHARAKKAAIRGGNTPTLLLEPDLIPADGPGFDTLALEEALDRLAALDQRKAKVVESRFFGGMTMEETALVLGVSISTVEADWRMARAWLLSDLSHD
jgi:RNA polymerase sigma factor (TIGR02999 family)